MKIVHITFGMKLGGLETMLVNIINQQAKSQSVALIVINDLYNADLLFKIDKKVKVILLGRKEKSLSVLPLIRLNIILFGLHADIIHSHAPKIANILLPTFLDKVVYTVHDVGIPCKYFKRYKYFYSISKCVQNDLLNRCGIHSVLIYNGINVGEFKQKVKNSPSQFKIIQISRLMHEKKGQHILIKALYLLKERGYNNISIDFVGEGVSFEYLENLICELNLKENAHLCGARDYSWVRDHLCDYDLLVQPSIFEGFGLTVAEGIAAKVPVLVSANEGPMEIIDNGKYGFYFKNGDIEDCANMIERIMNEDNAHIVESAWNYINETFNIKITAKKYIEEYKRILILKR